MADPIGTSIVQTALELRQLQPGSPALAGLDQAMEGRHGSSPTFDRTNEGFRSTDCSGMSIDEILAMNEGEDLASPSGPFGQLLAEAFVPAGVMPQRWDDEVMLPFAQRYGLWPLRANLPRAIWIGRCYSCIENSANQDGEVIDFDDIEGLAETLYEDSRTEGLTPEAAAAWAAA